MLGQVELDPTQPARQMSRRRQHFVPLSAIVLDIDKCGTQE